jgi:hypothetical protein
MSTAPPAKTNAETFFQNLGDGMKDSFDRLRNVLRQGFTDVDHMTVATQDAANSIVYRTTVTLDGSVSNDFPTPKPDANDEYWKRHNAVVDQVLQNRAQLMQKVVETLGGMLKIPA